MEVLKAEAVPPSATDDSALVPLMTADGIVVVFADLNMEGYLQRSLQL
jgi:hypothetical protein